MEGSVSGHFTATLTKEDGTTVKVVDQPNLFTDLIKYHAQSAMEACDLFGMGEGGGQPMAGFLELLNDESQASKDNVMRATDVLGTSQVFFLNASGTSMPANKKGTLVEGECSVEHDIATGATKHKYTVKFPAGVATGDINKLRIRGVRGDLISLYSTASSIAITDENYRLHNSINSVFYGGMPNHPKSVSDMFYIPDAVFNRNNNRVGSVCTNYTTQSVGFRLYATNNKVTGIIPTQMMSQSFMANANASNTTQLARESRVLYSSQIDNDTGNVCVAERVVSGGDTCINVYSRNQEGTYTLTNTKTFTLNNVSTTAGRIRAQFMENGAVGIIGFNTTFTRMSYYELDLTTNQLRTVLDNVATGGSGGSSADADSIDVMGFRYTHDSGIMELLMADSGASYLGFGVYAIDAANSRYRYLGSIGRPQTTGTFWMGCLGTQWRPFMNFYYSSVAVAQRPIVTYCDKSRAIYFGSKNGVCKLPFKPLLHDILAETNINTVYKGANDVLTVSYELTVNAKTTIS